MNKTQEDALEAELKTSAKAPQLTPEQIDAKIVDEAYHRFPGTTVTVCCLSLTNGFNVVGHSACVSEENFDAVIGSGIAFANAREKVWELEGYLLREQLKAAR